MKIQHYAIIFLMIMIPFSIVCRNVINNKILNLRDETRYNNFIDNATYDAVNVIHDLAGTQGNNNIIYGKNVPINSLVANAAIDRFYNTLCVDFNLPWSTNAGIGKIYFSKYVPAVIIVGYDGLYVYSVEVKNNSYEFKLKPKIPYSATFDVGNNVKAIFNFTLDNYVTINFADSSDKTKFGEGYYTDSSYVRTLRGYVGTPLDTNFDHIDDFQQYASYSGTYAPKFNPYDLRTSGGNNDIKGLFSTLTSNSDANATSQDDLNYGSLSYFLFEWARDSSNDYYGSQIAKSLSFLFYDKAYSDGTKKWSIKYNIDPDNPGNPNNVAQAIQPLPSDSYPVLPNYNDLNSFKKYDFSKVNQDYQFDKNKNITGYASAFHQIRREVIINTITSVMRQEFNEHNDYAKVVGVSYDFNIPSITNDDWNNTIDDVSVLAFMQGLPLGGDLYYNNYSLGGARIIQATNIFCEVVDANGFNATGVHKVYHKPTCQCLPRDNNGDLIYSQISLPDYIDSKNTLENPSTANWMGVASSVPKIKSTSGAKFYNQRFEEVSVIKPGHYPDLDHTGTPQEYNSSGIISEKISEEDARDAGYYPCSVCM